MSNATELLNLALRRLESYEEDCGADVVDMEVMEEIRAFLAAEPEAEPVAWVKITEYGDRRLSLDKLDGYEPLYTNPSPARKPMTDDEWMKIHDEWMASGYALNTRDFVRAIEKHHGLTLQDQCRGDKD